MLIAIIIAFAIVLAASAIPGIHLIATVPLAPFVGGFLGAGAGKLAQWQIPMFGLAVAGLALLPLAALATTAFFVDDAFLGLPDWVFVIAAILLVPYVWFGVTLGALISYYLRRRQTKDAN